jgi:2-polyprenyl-3-methyl-5-hydroxy-6-metoxy-1,4-benzoquinol methylase
VSSTSSAPQLTCPACGGGVEHAWNAPAGEQGLSDFGVAICSVCGTGVTEGDFPVDAELYEKGSYAPERARGAGMAAPILRLFDRRRLQFILRRYSAPARVIDAGAGRGRFVAAAAEAGFDATGVEPTDRGCGGARDMYGLELIQADIETAPVPPESCDVVTLWHVLEHVPNPGETVDLLKTWLKPGGGLLIGVPNFGSAQARLARTRWYHLDLPRHRTHFTEAGLHTLLARHGLVVVQTDHSMMEHNWFGMWQTAVSRFTSRPSYFFHLLKRNAPAKSPDLLISLLALPFVPVAILVELVAAARNSGGSIAVLAIKPDVSSEH